MESVEGAVVLTTGAARGIGLEFCRAALAAGASGVAVLDLRRDLGEAAARELARGAAARRPTARASPTVKFFQCDVSERASWRRALEEALDTFGRVDVLCNNAGVAEGDADAIVKINLLGVIYGSELALELARRTSTPRVIINLASAAGLFPLPGAANYTASKHGVVGLSRALALPANAVVPAAAAADAPPSSAGSAGQSASPQEHAPVVHCLCPVFVRTAMASSPRALAMIARHGGALRAEDVAAEMLRLCTETSSVVEIMRLHTGVQVVYRNGVSTRSSQL